MDSQVDVSFVKVIWWQFLNTGWFFCSFSLLDLEDMRVKSLGLKTLSLMIALAILASAPVVLRAQVKAVSAEKTAASTLPSQWDIFVGYSYLSPHGTAQGYPYQNIVYGGVSSIARYFNRYVGLQFEGDWHDQSQDWPPNSNNKTDNSNDDFANGSGGLILRYPAGNFTPWAHALFGGERVGSLYQPDTWGWAATVGGGLDYSTPWLHHHLAIRLVQADYQYASIPFAPDFGGASSFNIARLSGGVVFHIGSIAPPAQVSLACSPNPVSVYPGDLVTVTATTGSLDPKLHAVYSWSGSGVKGSDTTATVATDSLPAGTYTVKGTVKEGKSGKEGAKPWETAECSAIFTVKPFEPPTISCTPNPATIKPGDSSTITTAAVSPQNRPLTYSYSASSGSISGTSATAEFNSAGAPTGAVGITCNVADDKGGNAAANTIVTIVVPYVAPAPRTQALCSLSFEKDKLRPARVDNVAKACLDEVALDLLKQPDAKVVVVGEATVLEKTPRKGHKHTVNLAAQRAVNAKQYLVTEKGIDATRVSVVTGATDSQTAQNYLVPSGADFATDVTGTAPVDETVVKPNAVKKHISPRPAHKKPAAPAKPAQ
jgi:hypothetical protein